MSNLAMSPLLRRLLRRLRLKVAAVGESESISTELAEPVSAHPSPAGRPTSLGGPGVEGPAGSPLVGVSALRYPSGLAGPPDSSAYSGGQMSLSLATDITASAQLDPSLYSTSSRQPPAATVAAAARLPPESLTRVTFRRVVCFLRSRRYDGVEVLRALNVSRATL